MEPEAGQGRVDSVEQRRAQTGDVGQRGGDGGEVTVRLGTW